MALKLIQRFPLLGQFGIHCCPAVCPSRLCRLPNTRNVGQLSGVACLCTPVGGCVRRLGCRRLHLDSVRRSLSTTIIREPSFVTCSSVGLHRDSGPQFCLTQLHGPTAAEEQAFQQRLQSCSSSRQVLSLLHSVAIMSDIMAAAALHRVADLEQVGNSLKDPEVLEKDTIRALCFQLEQD